MKKTLTMLAAAAAMITMQAATSVEGVAQLQNPAVVAGEKLDSGLGSMVYGESLDDGLGTMVYGESLDSGLGQLTVADLQQYFPPRAIQTASLAD